jgi:hypothetical protein
MRRAQASLEYIITYGWAFLVILVVLGALAYFGVINPSKWIPDECDFGPQMECVDYQATASTDRIDLYLRNNFGKGIVITEAKVIREDGTVVGTVNFVDGDPAVEAGATEDIYLDNLNNVLDAEEKQRHVIVIEFRRDTMGSPPKHNVTGVLYTRTK